MTYLERVGAVSGMSINYAIGAYFHYAIFNSSATICVGKVGITQP